MSTPSLDVKAIHDRFRTPVLRYVTRLVGVVVIMMIACGGMRFRFGRRRGDGRETARQILDRKYASGEIGKDQYDAVRRDLNG